MVKVIFISILSWYFTGQLQQDNSIDHWKNKQQIHKKERTVGVNHVRSDCSGIEKCEIGVRGSHHNITDEIAKVGFHRSNGAETTIQIYLELPKLLAHFPLHLLLVLLQKRFQFDVRFKFRGHVHALDIHLQILLKVEGDDAKVSEISAALENVLSVNLEIVISAIMQ